MLHFVIALFCALLPVHAWAASSATSVSACLKAPGLESDSVTPIQLVNVVQSVDARNEKQVSFSPVLPNAQNTSPEGSGQAKSRLNSIERARIALEQSSAMPPASTDLCNMLVDAARDNELPLSFFANLIWQESRFDSTAISPVGAMGIAQFMPDVAKELGLDAFDVSAALPASAHLLQVLFRHFGNLGLAAAAYNAGPKRVATWLAKRIGLPRETRNYVQVITGQSAELWRDTATGALMPKASTSLPCHDSPSFGKAEQIERDQAEMRVVEAHLNEKDSPPAARIRARKRHSKDKPEKQRLAERRSSPGRYKRRESGKA